MSNVNPYSQYKQTSVGTASPERLVMMLYDGAVRFLHQAKAAMEAHNIEETSNHIGKTQAIIAELMIALNMDYELSQHLYNLYDYFNRRLTEANVKKDPVILEEILQHITELQQTWNEAAAKTKIHPEVAGGLNIEG